MSDSVPMSASAPTAPGRLGEQLDPQRLLSYLTDLSGWIAGRRSELDELDRAAQTSTHAGDLTPDIRLGLTLWQAIKKRTDVMLTVWDSGRVGPLEREKLSQLIWGRLDTPGGVAGGAGMSGMSLPEACRLSDALTAQLRQRLQLDPSGSAALVRIRDLRASLERLRDQVALEPPETMDAARGTLATLASRVQEVAEKAARGGDVGGMLGPLEADAGSFERDLIVGGALRRQNAGRVAALTAAREALAARAPALKELVATVVAALTPAPKYAVPDVANLGPVPAAVAELDAYELRLVQAGRAMDVVESAYTGALGELDRLRADLAEIADDSGEETLVTMVGAAQVLLAREPVPLDAARSLVTACRQYAATLGGGRTPGGGAS